MNTGDFAAIAITLYAAHHAGDYWIQTDADAREKGLAGPAGRLACLRHVVTYLMTQTLCLLVMAVLTGFHGHWWAWLTGLAISGITHYTADRREHGALFWLARRIPGKAAFLTLGRPRDLTIFAKKPDGNPRGPDPLDNPQLATGAWALDQAWHILFGVFVAALVIAA